MKEEINKEYGFEGNIPRINMSARVGNFARFNADFKSYYGFAPSSSRKSASESTFGSNSLTGSTGLTGSAGSNSSIDSNASSSLDEQLDNCICLELDYQPPYDWKLMMSFFQLRAVAGVEQVTPDLEAYRRSIGILRSGVRYIGWLEVRPLAEQNKVQCIISMSLLPVVESVIALVRKAFDLNLRADTLPVGLISGIRLPGCFDTFEMCVRAILGQQITVKAAHVIAGRVVKRLGSEVKTPWPEVNLLFPEPKDVTILEDSIYEELGQLGVIRSKSGAILSLANSLQSCDLSFHLRNHPMEVKDKLLRIKGIGPWTAEYLTMRAMSWPDAFPPGDAGIRHGLMNELRDVDGNLIMDAQRNLELGYSKQRVAKRFEAEAQQFASAYKPWRSYLTLTLWQGGLMKQE